MNNRIISNQVLIVLTLCVSLALAASAQTPVTQNSSQTHIVAFDAINPSQIIGDRELLAAFNKVHPQGVRTHHFKTQTIGIALVGYICVDGDEGMRAVVEALKSSSEVKFLQTVPAEPKHIRNVYAVENLETLTGQTMSAQAQTNQPPSIVSTSPAIGDTEVDPAINEINVTFDRDMRGGMSWTGGGENFPSVPEGKRGYWRDKRTCVLPVRLKPAWMYRVGINSPSHRNFTSAEGIPARPTAIFFTTKGASQEQKDMIQVPRIIAMAPQNGAQNVSPSITELQVTFSVPMREGFSWTGGGPAFPTIPEGKKPAWSPDGKTCTLPVILEPNWTYKLGINSPSHKNFSSRGGQPVEPVVYTFSTGAMQ
ncbi:MAG TPA: hypothetical protein PLB62_02105 [Candidatus Sumerlaeota bacterium]|nr:hypothetical protein [Candidatus Sumerlaeota bacterium]